MQKIFPITTELCLTYDIIAQISGTETGWQEFGGSFTFQNELPAGTTIDEARFYIQIEDSSVGHGCKYLALIREIFSPHIIPITI